MATRAASLGTKKKAAIWIDGSDTDPFLLCRAILGGSLLLIRPYPYTEATYMGDKYYLRHGHLSRLSRLGQKSTRTIIEG